MWYFVDITLPADDVTLGARPSAGTLMTKFGHMWTEPELEMSVS